MRLENIFKGGYHTVYSGDIPAGKPMQAHYSTSEAVLIILEGSTLLIFQDKQVHLSKGSVYPIPALKAHSLEALENLKFYLILGSSGHLKTITVPSERLNRLLAYA